MTIEQLRKQDKKHAQAIANYLIKRIETDQCLKEKIEATNKTLKGCIDYCKTEARKQAEDGCAMIPDDEVYEWAVHYFLEDSIKESAKKISSTARGSIDKVRKIKMIDEFRTFIARGNVLDLAVGVIIGGAFQSLVKSLTDNIISPILGCFSEVDFNS